MAGGFALPSSSKAPTGERPPFSLSTVIVAFASALGGFLFGYEIGIIECDLYP